MIGNILSIGSIAGAIVDGNSEETIKDSDPAAFSIKIANALTMHDTATLELLVTSILEPDLF